MITSTSSSNSARSKNECCRNWRVLVGSALLLPPPLIRRLPRHFCEIASKRSYLAESERVRDITRFPVCLFQQMFCTF
jgi:hypothetical protein